MNELTTDVIWVPDYPKAMDKKVSLLNIGLETYLSDKRPGVTIINSPIESPACFWIDKNHLYLRANWEQWFTISLDSPDHVAAICAAHYCHITYSLNNEISNDTAPVYRITELPGELFAETVVEEDVTDDGDDAKEEVSSATQREVSDYEKCQKRVTEIIKVDYPELTIFKDTEIDGDHVALAVADESTVVVLLDILPEDRDFTFIPDTGENLHNPMNSWETNVIALDFISKLQRIRTHLKNEPDAEVEVIIGLVANKTTLDELQFFFADELEDSNLKLFTYAELSDELGKLFPQEEGEDEVDPDDE